MLVLDIPRLCPSGFAYVDVPLYHRVHLGLAANRSLHGCLLAGAKEPHLPELVISPFEFDQWDKIWRLNMTVADRAGVFHEVCGILKNNGAHVLAAESSTIQQQNFYQLEIVMELDDERRIEWIRLSLLARFLKEMSFLHDDTPRLRIQRLNNLWHAKRDFEMQRQNPKGFVPQKIDIMVKWAEKTPPQVFRLVLPSKVREILKKTIRGNSQESRDDGFYLRLSDTKNRFLRVLYFRSDEPVMHARIEYVNRPSATADITEALKKHGFNILTAYFGPSSGCRSRLELVARCERLCGMRAAQKKAALEEALSSSVGAADLHIAIGYPRNYAKFWDRKGIKASPKTQLKIQPAETGWVENLHHDLEMQYMDLKSKAERGLDPSDLARWKLVRRLIEKYDELAEAHTKKEKVLFVSCHYDSNQLEMIKAKAELKGFSVVSGKDLFLFDTVTLGLLNKISSCTHFLGVWSRDGAQQTEQHCWPSPWLLWEFGVAEAFGLTWRLLISNKLEEAAWKRIAPQRQHRFFGMDFESSLGEILDVLSALPAGKPPVRDTAESHRAVVAAS